MNRLAARTRRTGESADQLLGASITGLGSLPPFPPGADWARFQLNLMVVVGLLYLKVRRARPRALSLCFARKICYRRRMKRLQSGARFGALSSHI